MKISKLKYIATLLLMAQLASVHSQDYKKSVKIRPVDNYGLSFKQLTGFENGYEISLSKIEYVYRLGALRVFQKPAWPLKSDKLFFCYGYGVHLSAGDGYDIYNPFKPFSKPRKYNRTYLSAGLDGYAGLEYRLLKHPLTLNLDYVPNFEFFGPAYFRSNHVLAAGISVVF